MMGRGTPDFSRIFLYSLVVSAMHFPLCLSAGSSVGPHHWDPQFHQEKAKDHLRGGRLVELKREVQILKLLAPSSEATLALEARLFESENDWPKIMELTGAAIQLPDEVKVIRAKALIAVGNTAEAEKILIKQIGKLGSDHRLFAEIWEAYGDLAAKINRKEAAAHYRKALTLAPGNQGIRMKMAAELAKRGQANESAEMLFPIVESPEADSSVRYQYISYLEQSRQIEKVGKTLQAWIARFPEIRWQELSYANLLEQVGEEGESRALRNKWNLNSVEGRAPASEKAGMVAETVKTLKVQPGDTLQSISERLYGTTKRWREIRNANITLLSNGDQITPGMELRIPHSVTGKSEEAQSVKPSSFLVSPNDEAAESGESVSFTAESSGKESRSGFLWASAGFSAANNSLSGSGFQADAHPDMGSKQAIQSTLFLSSVWGLNASASRSSATYASLPGLSPASLVVTQKSLLLGVRIAVGGLSQASGWFRNLALGIGWQQRQQDATATTPNVVVSAYRASGPTLSLESSSFIYGKLSALAKAAVFLPTKYSERNTNTGHFDSAMGMEFGIHALYPLLSGLSGTAGLSYQKFQARFSGSGTRGSAGATEGSSAWILPIGIQWEF